MVDAQESLGGGIRSELESLRRDVGCLMREMHQVKTALFKLRGSTPESSPDEELCADSRRTTEEESPKAPPVSAEVEELGTAVLQSQLSEYHLGEYHRRLRSENISD